MSSQGNSETVEVVSGSQAELILGNDRPVTIVFVFQDKVAPWEVLLSKQILALAERYSYSAEVLSGIAIRLHRDPGAAAPSWSSQQLRVMKNVAHPRLNLHARPAEDIDPMRIYDGPLTRTMEHLRTAAEGISSTGGLTSATPSPEVFRAATDLGEAFLTLGREYAEKITPRGDSEESPRRRLFKRGAPAADTSASTQIWWAYGGGMRDGTVKWPNWVLVNGQVKGPGAAGNVFASGPRRELFPLEVGLTLVADEPSGDISWYCDKDPEDAWRSIRFGGIDDGDLLARAIRAARFAIDEISGS